MAFADDLLDQSYHLANKDDDPIQASLRRAVSSAYYAVFHLLVDDAVGKWAVSRQRSAIGRTFEHKHMKNVCLDHVKNFYIAGKPAKGEKLKNIAQTFSILQQRRHTAYYDVSFDLDADQCDRSSRPCKGDIRRLAFNLETDQVQDFVLDLLFPRAADILKSSQDVVA